MSERLLRMLDELRGARSLSPPATFRMGDPLPARLPERRLVSPTKRAELNALYDENQTLPEQWLFMAQGLRAAALATWIEWRAGFERFIAAGDQALYVPWMGPTGLMLAGLALENVLKAASIRAGKGYELTHDLVKLARMLDVQLSAAEEALLAELTVYVTWLGRYPVPKDRAAMRGLEEITSGDWDVIDAFYRRMGGWIVRPSPRERFKG